MYSLKIVGFTLLLTALTLGSKPIQRENGVWFPGKSCGIKNEIKYLQYMPEDTSKLACTFVYSNGIPKKDLKDHMNIGEPQYCSLENANLDTGEQDIGDATSDSAEDCQVVLENKTE